MRNNAALAFDPNALLTRIENGTTTREYRSKQLFNTSEKRLARIPLLLPHFGKESRPESVIPKVSQQTLAAMVGTTRSRVSHFMNRFRKMGFIHYNGGLQVHSALLTVVLRD